MFEGIAIGLALIAVGFIFGLCVGVGVGQKSILDKMMPRPVRMAKATA